MVAKVVAGGREAVSGRCKLVGGPLGRSEAVSIADCQPQTGGTCPLQAQACLTPFICSSKDCPMGALSPQVLRCVTGLSFKRGAMDKTPGNAKRAIEMCC